jgi:hypothetical protein
MCKVYGENVPSDLVMLGCALEACWIEGNEVDIDTRRRLSGSPETVIFDLALTYATEDPVVNMAPGVVRLAAAELFEEAVAADPDVVKDAFNEAAEGEGSDMRIGDVEKAEILEVEEEGRFVSVGIGMIVLIVFGVCVVTCFTNWRKRKAEEKRRQKAKERGAGVGTVVDSQL